MVAVVTPRAHRSQPCARPSRARAWKCGTRSDSIRSPISASRAGSSVTAAATATATTIAAEYPSALTIGMSASTSERSAMTTVPPANTTALPALPVARAIASSTGTPSRSRSR